jgi:transcriptional regulator with XRE-family HTH domain
MITRNDLVSSKEYWMVKIQTELFAELEKYLTDNNMTRTQFAEKLGVTKGYVSQILNGDFNHSMAKLIELSLAMGKVPVFHFEDVDKFKVEKMDTPLDLPVEKPKVNIKKRVAELV